MYEPAYADYTAGQYDLAIDGFQAFIRTSRRRPRPTRRSSTSATRSTTPARTATRVAALQKVITDYPQSNSVSVRLLQARSDLRSAQAARRRAEGVRDGDAEVPELLRRRARQQALERLKRRETSSRLGGAAAARRSSSEPRTSLPTSEPAAVTTAVLELEYRRPSARITRRSRSGPYRRRQLTSVGLGAMRRSVTACRPRAPTAAAHRRHRPRRRAGRCGRRGSRWCSACCRPCRPTAASAAGPRRRSACP